MRLCLQSLLHIQVLTALYSKGKHEYSNTRKAKGGGGVNVVIRLRCLVYLVTGRLLLSVDTKEDGFLCVVVLHLHHDVIFVRSVFGAETQTDTY